MQSTTNHHHKYFELCAKTLKVRQTKSSSPGSQPAEITKKLDESIPFVVPQSDSKYPHWTYQLRISKICRSAVSSANLQPLLQGLQLCSAPVFKATPTKQCENNRPGCAYKQSTKESYLINKYILHAEI